MACSARARRAPSRRVRPRGEDGSERGTAPVSITTPPRRDERDREVSGRRRITPAPAPGRAPSLIESFNYAFEGIIHVLRTQRNLRIHFGVAIVVLIAGLAVDVSRLELI